MKRIITLSILLVGAAAGLGSRASAQETAVRVNVPFDFAVGSHVLPSGEYRIAPEGSALIFENRDRGAQLYALAEHGDASMDGTSKLTFDVVEGKYFLRKITTVSSKMSADFPVSKIEKHSRELAQQGTKLQDVAQTRSIYAETASHASR